MGDQRLENPNLKGKDKDNKSKTKKIWKWKQPLKAIASMGMNIGSSHNNNNNNQRQNPNPHPHHHHHRVVCEFSLRVQALEGLPSAMNGRRATIQWRRKDGGVRTRPAVVVDGVARFSNNSDKNNHAAAAVSADDSDSAMVVDRLHEEVLVHRCCLFATRTGGNPPLRYDSKFFEISAHIDDTIELCKHRIDLSRMLPDTYNNSSTSCSSSSSCLDHISGSWTTQFKVTAKPARGASLFVTIGFIILSKEILGAPNSNSNSDSANPSSVSSKQQSNTCDHVQQFQRRLSLGNHDLDLENEFFVKGLHRLLNPNPPAAAPPLRQSQSQRFGYGRCSNSDVSMLFDFKPKLKFFPGEDNPGGFRNSSPNKDDDNGSITFKNPSLVDEHIRASDFGHEIIKEKEKIQFEIMDKKIEVKDILESNYHNHERVAEFREEEAMDKEMLAKIQEHEIEGEMIGKDEQVSDNGFHPGIEVIEKEEPKDKQVSQNIREPIIGIVGQEWKDDNVSQNSHEPTAEKERKDEKISQNIFEPIVEEERKDEKISPSIHEHLIGNTDEQKEISKENGLSVNVSEEPIAFVADEDSTCSDLDAVEGEFLSLLGIDNKSYSPSPGHSPSLSQFSSSSDNDPDPESPRARLLKQFEKEYLSQGYYCFEMGNNDGFEDKFYGGESLLQDDGGLESMLQVGESELQKAAQTEQSRARAKILEGAETEALMKQMGMDDSAFKPSQEDVSCNTLSQDDNLVELPPLAEGYGPLVNTVDGGLLRSMDPALFRNSKCKGSLVMQISKPVVVPAEMGSDIMDILNNLASVGVDKLTAEVHKRMPLADITGKTIQQFAVNTAPSLKSARDRKLSVDCSRHSESVPIDAYMNESYDSSSQYSSAVMWSSKGNRYAEYVSLEELAPLAMDKLEALSVEGLKIQSDMGEVEAPSNVNAYSVGGVSLFQGLKAQSSGSLGLEGTGCLQLVETKEYRDDISGLLDMSITLDEWMQLDSGVVDAQYSSERTAKILAAHHAIGSDLVVADSTDIGMENNYRCKQQSAPRWGYMGNTLTIGLLVQLRDPLRNFEPVGAPMMALVQAERIVVPPKPKLYKRVSENGNNEEVDDSESSEVEKVEEISVPEKTEISQFRITQIHVAGIKSEDEDAKKIWCNPKQQQSSSRWLIANGMGKNSKHSMLKSKQSAKPTPSSTKTSTKGKPGGSFWSISSRIFGDRGDRKKVDALDPHTRNPNVNLPDNL